MTLLQFLLTSPCAFLAFDYSILPRLSIFLDADDCLWMRRAWIVKTFVWLDVLTFCAQLGGAALQATTANLAKIGTKACRLSPFPRAVHVLMYNACRSPSVVSFCRLSALALSSASGSSSVGVCESLLAPVPSCILLSAIDRDL